MTMLSDLLSDEQRNILAKNEIRIGNVYRINMNISNGIIPKGNDDSRNKFFIIIGKNNNGDYYGGVIFNSKINQNIPEVKKIYHIPIKCSEYDFLTHDSFVDCSSLKEVATNKVFEWEYKGILKAEDIELINETLKESPTTNKAKLKYYGII